MLISRDHLLSHVQEYVKQNLGVFFYEGNAVIVTKTILLVFEYLEERLFIPFQKEGETK